MRKGSISRARDISESFSPEPMAQGPGPARRCGKDGRGADVARTGAAHLASPRTLPRHHAGPGQFGAFLVRKAHYLHFTPTMFPSPSSAPSAYGRPSTAKSHDAAPLDGGHPSGRPRPGSARARRPLRWAGRGTKRGSGRPTGGRPLRWAGRGPRIRMISRRSLPAQRPPHAGISAVGRAVGLCTPAPPQPLDQAAATPAVRAPPHAQADTDDDPLSARMPRYAPVEDRIPVTNSTSGGRLPAPSHDNRRTTPSGERARPQGHGRGRPPGSAPSRPRRPQDAAHAASQRPYPLSGPVV